MVGAGSETVSAITFDCGVGRGNGFGQEMGNPIFGPIGGVGAGRQKHAHVGNDLRVNVQGRGAQADKTDELRGPKRANKDDSRLPERPRGVP